MPDQPDEGTAAKPDDDIAPQVDLPVAYRRRYGAFGFVETEPIDVAEPDAVAHWEDAYWHDTPPR